MKNRFICIFLIIFCTGIIQGQEAKNVISVGPNVSTQSSLFPNPSPGLSIEYERIVNNYFSFGVDLGVVMFFNPYIEIQVHYYPANMFYIGLGLGIYYLILVPELSPEIGWKINIGKTNSWVLIPSVTARVHNFIILWEICVKFGYKF